MFCTNVSCYWSKNGKGLLYHLLYQLENGMKTLPMFQPECSGLLQGKHGSYSWTQSTSVLVPAHVFGITVTCMRLISRCHRKHQKGAVGFWFPASSKQPFSKQWQATAWGKAHLLPRTCQHGHIRLPLAAPSLDEDHQHTRVLSRGGLCVVFFRKHFAMHPIGDQLDPSHCGRMLDCAASLANYYSHMTN